MPASASFQKSDAPLGTQTMTFLSAASAAPVSIMPTAAITLTYFMSVLAPLNRRAMHQRFLHSNPAETPGLTSLLMRLAACTPAGEGTGRSPSGGTMGNSCPAVQQIVEIAL